MKLYHYDHCPYCVKARMIFGLKNVDFELIGLLNDDEETPIAMIGQKMLPILERGPKDYLPESLDIIAFVDSLDGAPMVGESLRNPRLDQWLLDVRNYHYRLAMPRWPQMPLPEFATPSSVAYFTHKKEMIIGSFDENLKRTESLIEEAHGHLQVLENLMIGAPWFWGESLSIDDFHVFASLRCLTTTRGLRFPDKINHYMNSMSEKTKVPLHWELSL